MKQKTYALVLMAWVLLMAFVTAFINDNRISLLIGFITIILMVTFTIYYYVTKKSDKKKFDWTAEK